MTQTSFLRQYILGIISLNSSSYEKSEILLASKFSFYDEYYGFCYCGEILDVKRKFQNFKDIQFFTMRLPKSINSFSSTGFGMAGESG